MGSRKVVGVARSSSADDLAIDLCAAGLGVLVLLEDEGAGAFTDDEAVTIRVEGTRCVLGVVVARREGLHGVEASDGRFVDRSLGSARHHDIGLAVADGVESGDHAVVRRCAGRDRAVELGPMKPYFMEMNPAAMSAIMRGMKKGLNRGVPSPAA